MFDSTSQAFEEARRHNVMASELASKACSFDPTRLPRRAIVEIKADGIGILDVNGRVQSLAGVAFDAVSHLAHELAAIREAFGQPTVLHGEYVESAGFNACLASFNAGQGTGAVLLWDALPFKAWHGLEPTAPLCDRRAMLGAAIDCVRPAMVRAMPYRLIDQPSDEAIQAAAQLAFDADEEGIVAKDWDSPYWRGRSPYWQKLKRDRTVDVPIQSCELDGGRIRRLTVTVEGRPANVGAISEAWRCQPAEFRRGRLVEIKHYGIMPSGALKGASFVRFRDDKESAR